MLVLIGFAVLAGAGTAVSPCVLPVLPALLSAAGAGGRRRPVGVVTGLATTFFVTIAGLASVAGGVGLGADPLRYVAVAVLCMFGLVLAVPRLASALEEPLAALSRLGPRSRGDGFASGLIVGGALGFVYTPCAGPILAAVISVGAASGRAIGVAAGYAAGTALVLLALTIGGRRVADRVRAAGRGEGLRRALGLVMVLTAVAVALMLDVKLDQQIAREIPDVNLTASLERSHAVKSRLTDLRGGPGHFANAGTGLRDAGPAPELRGTQRWFGSPPLTMAGLRGRVVLIDFWTYTCINCIRTLPYLEAWDARYRRAGLVIVGVHTPEFAFEHDAGNVAAAIRQLGIHYPVVQDNDMAVWNAYGNQYWPADYLIDRSGHVRYASFGEGDYDRTEAAIRELIGTAGANASPRGVVVPSALTTPETYLGTARAQGWAVGPLSGTHAYKPHPVASGEFAFRGRWTIGPQQALAGAGAGIDANIQAKNVYLVMGGRGSVHVILDGRPLTTVAVAAERLYTLASLKSDGRHLLSLQLSPGVRAFSFTFG